MLMNFCIKLDTFSVLSEEGLILFIEWQDRKYCKVLLSPTHSEQNSDIVMMFSLCLAFLNMIVIERYYTPFFLSLQCTIIRVDCLCSELVLCKWKMFQNRFLFSKLLTMDRKADILKGAISNFYFWTKFWCSHFLYT